MYYNEMLMMEHSPIVTINDFIKGIKMKIKQVNEVIRKYLSFKKNDNLLLEIIPKNKLLIIYQNNFVQTLIYVKHIFKQLI